MQAADHHLTHRATDAVEVVFASVRGGNDSHTQLEEVAGEDLTLKRRRIQPEEEPKGLEDGTRILS